MPSKPPQTGPGTQSPWDSSGFAFAPNTNTLDRESMPSDAAEAARQKSAAVMAALKSGNKGEADRLMGQSNKPQGQLVPQGPIKWLARKLSGKKEERGDVLEGKVMESDGESVMTEAGKSGKS